MAMVWKMTKTLMMMGTAKQMQRTTTMTVMASWMATRTTMAMVWKMTKTLMMMVTVFLTKMTSCKDLQPTSNLQLKKETRKEKLCKLELDSICCNHNAEDPDDD